MCLGFLEIIILMRKQYPKLFLNTLHVQLEIIDMAQRGGVLKLPLLPPPPPTYGPEEHFDVRLKVSLLTCTFKKRGSDLQTKQTGDLSQGVVIRHYRVAVPPGTSTVKNFESSKICLTISHLTILALIP